jgi:hypothetical protein
MSILIEARKSEKPDGTAFFPFDNIKAKEVQIVDERWVENHWSELKDQLGRVENIRILSVIRLNDALSGKSADPQYAANAVAKYSRPVQDFWAALRNSFQPMVPGKIYWAKDIEPQPGDAALLETSDFMQGLVKEPRALAAAELTIGLSAIRVCVWLDRKKQTRFGLYCRDVMSVIYATRVMGCGIAGCLRCGQVFLRGRSDNQFCSDRCKNTFLTAKRRKKNASEGRRGSKARMRKRK